LQLRCDLTCKQQLKAASSSSHTDTQLQSRQQQLPIVSF
jgi:hypothetical protein